MVRARAGLGDRRRRRRYASFLAAAAGLAEASSGLRPSFSRPTRLAMGAAVLRVGEADRAVVRAITSASAGDLRAAAADLDLARAALAEAGRRAAGDVVRRRSLSLVG